MSGSSCVSSYSFDWIVLIFGYIVERTNNKILSSHFLQFPSWTQIMTSFPVLQKLSYSDAVFTIG